MPLIHNLKPNITLHIYVITIRFLSKEGYDMIRKDKELSRYFNLKYPKDMGVSQRDLDRLRVNTNETSQKTDNKKSAGASTSAKNGNNKVSPAQRSEAWAKGEQHGLPEDYESAREPCCVVS